eukprot:gene7608-10359_t
MDCIKSQNQFINTLMFPGSIAKSSYTTETFEMNRNLKLLYIPFMRKSSCGIPCSTSYVTAAPSYVPALLAIRKNNQANIFCIHFHGNACDLGQISVCAERESDAFNAHYMIIDYPRFGISDGHPNEVVMDEVAICVFDYVTKALQVPPSRIVLIGRSIGTGPACSVAAYAESQGKSVASVILQSPYTSLRNTAADLLGCVSFFMLDRWPNWYHLTDISNKNIIRSPVLFLHADQDKIIAVHHSQILHDLRVKAGMKSELFIQRSSANFIKGHNFFDYNLDLLKPIKDFLKTNEISLTANDKSKLSLQIPLEIINICCKVPDQYSHHIIRSTQHDQLSSDQSLPTAYLTNNNNEKQYCSCGMNKCDNAVRMGWFLCPCVQCAEGCIACNIKWTSNAFYYSTGMPRPFDYDSLRPQAVEQGSLLNMLFSSTRNRPQNNKPPNSKSKSSFDKLNIDEKSSEKNKNNSKSDFMIKNPLIVNKNNNNEEDLPFATVISNIQEPVQTSNNNNNKINESSEVQSLEYVPG